MMLDDTHRLCSLGRWCAGGCSPCPLGSAPVRAGTAPASSARSSGASGWTTRSMMCCSPWVPVYVRINEQMMGGTAADDGVKHGLCDLRDHSRAKRSCKDIRVFLITTVLIKSTHNPRGLLYGVFICAYAPVSVDYSILTRRSNIVSHSCQCIAEPTITHTHITHTERERENTRNSFRFSDWRHSKRYILWLSACKRF